MTELFRVIYIADIIMRIQVNSPQWTEHPTLAISFARRTHPSVVRIVIATLRKEGNPQETDTDKPKPKPYGELEARNTLAPQITDCLVPQTDNRENAILSTSYRRMGIVVWERWR